MAAIIPFSRSVGAVEYKKIAKDIHAIAKKHGIFFDKSKKNANDFFYAPCTPSGGDKPFFELFDGPCRQPLDVDTWLEGG